MYKNRPFGKKQNADENNQEKKEYNYGLTQETYEIYLKNCLRQQIKHQAQSSSQKSLPRLN